MEEMKNPTCSRCGAVWQKSGATNCWSSGGDAPPRPGNCPSDCDADIVEGSFRRYTDGSEEAKIALVAARVEGLCYRREPGSDAICARWTRVEDTIAFAKLMGFRTIGIATCIGLLDESERLSAILRAQGFEAVSVCCKAGSLDKNQVGVQEEEKVRPGTFEPACNPIAQAEVLNRRATDLNLIVGLCIGHDILFTRASQAPVSTLVVKDRVTGHDPVKVLYGQNFYYKRLQKQRLKVD
ncbi:MAG TPA: DUF1847 domain-containing protein [Verrucomicrobiae bacterium]|nr:DUF1847 domain-containing protein [Verrucomicrobiae bacterium]